MGDSWVEVEGEWGEWKEGGRPPKREEVKDFSFSSSSEEGKVRKCQKVPFRKLFSKKSLPKSKR